ncbi:MAG: tetratricopeptide repeat protein [Alphaproteobacteria bacterium]|nr:tetratricopeptide repeat protein [Alphaproteobacteria bacterium]
MKSKEKIMVHKGIDRIKRNQLEEGLEFFDKALEINPLNADAWNNRGVALFKMGKLDDALKCYDKALKADHENLDSLRNKGFVLRSMQRFEEALECYEQVIALEAVLDVSDLRNKATVLVGLGRLEDALNTLMEAAIISPSMQLEMEIDVLRKALLDMAMRTENI